MLLRTWAPVEPSAMLMHQRPSEALTMVLLTTRLLVEPVAPSMR